MVDEVFMIVKQKRGMRTIIPAFFRGAGGARYLINN
jgi:hypothetical protein